MSKITNHLPEAYHAPDHFSHLINANINALVAEQYPFQYEFQVQSAVSLDNPYAYQDYRDKNKDIPDTSLMMARDGLDKVEAEIQKIIEHHKKQCDGIGVNSGVKVKNVTTRVTHSESSNEFTVHITVDLLTNKSIV